MKKLLFPALAAAALMTGCAGVDVPTTSASLLMGAAQPFRSMADALQPELREVEGAGMRVSWTPAGQQLLAVREETADARYTHALFEFRPAAGGTAILQRVALADLGARKRAYALVALRAVGQDLTGSDCGGNCLRLLPGQYEARVVMYDGSAPKANVGLGAVTVDERVTIRQQRS